MLNVEDVKVGGTLTSAIVRSAIRPVVDKDPNNPYTGTITRVNMLILPDGNTFPIHYGGATGRMHKFIDDNVTWAENVTITAVFKPVDPQQALINKLLNK